MLFQLRERGWIPFLDRLRTSGNHPELPVAAAGTTQTRGERGWCVGHSCSWEEC